MSHQDGLGIAYVGRVCIVVWRRAVTLERFDRQRRALKTLAQRHPGGMGFLCVVEPTAAPPDAEMRKASQLMVAELADHLRCVACAIEGKGTFASAARNVLANMALSVRIDGPVMRFVTSVEAAATWLAQYVDGVVASEIQRAHARLVERMDA